MYIYIYVYRYIYIYVFISGLTPDLLSSAARTEAELEAWARPPLVSFLASPPPASLRVLVQARSATHDNTINLIRMILMVL